jgi:hypothetical protein
MMQWSKIEQWQEAPRNAVEWIAMLAVAVRAEA